MLDAAPQSRPTSARRTIGFTGERSPLRFCLFLLVIPSGELFIDRSRSEELCHLAILHGYTLSHSVAHRLLFAPLTGLGIASLKADLRPARQARLTTLALSKCDSLLSLLRPVTNGGSIAGAATLTASVRRTRAQLARQFEQAMFISFVLVTVFA
jgi:hypothetical protein